MSKALLFAAILLYVPVAARAEDLLLNGQVRDSLTRIPIRQVQVTLVGNGARSPVLTDDNGLFVVSLPGAQVGDLVRLRMEKTGYSEFDQHVTISRITLNLELVPKKNNAPPQIVGTDTMPLDQRPWVSITDPPKLEVVVEHPVIARVPLKNTGNTPALNIHTQVFLLAFPNSYSDQQIRMAFDRQRNVSEFKLDGDLPPTGTRITEVHSLEPLTVDLRSAFHKGVALLFLSEVLKYDDIKGKHHTTRACFHVMAAPTDPDNVKGFFAYCPFGNDMN